MMLNYLYTRQRMLYASLCFLFCAIGLSFEGLSQNVNFRQPRNGTASPWDIEWVYGVLNKTHSTYAEGMSVPQRIIITGIKPASNDNHTFTFKHQISRGDAFAYDFLTSWDQAVSTAGGKLDQLLTSACIDGNSDCSSLRGGSNVEVGTINDNSGGSVNGENISTRMAAYTALYGARTFTIYGNASISNPVINLDGYEKIGNNWYANYTIGWTSASSKIMIEVAGHLALTDDGTNSDLAYENGAGKINGAPYHFKLGKLDGASIGSQDNQIMLGDAANTCEVSSSDNTLTECETANGQAVFTLNNTVVTSDPDATVQWFTDKELSNAIDLGAGNTYTSGNATIYALVTKGSCSDVAEVTLVVNPMPTVYTLSGNNDFCSGSSSGSVTLSSSQTGIQYQLQLKDGQNWNNVQNSKTGNGSSLTWSGLAVGTYRVIATNTTTTCSSQSNEVTLIGKACATTFTKGFWGNAGGKDCNSKDALTLMKGILTADQVFGNTSGRKFTLKVSDLSQYTNVKFCNKTVTYIPIFRMLPGGTTPTVLPTNANIVWADPTTWGSTLAACSNTSWGSITNNLLAQTIALYFNLGYDSKLGGTVLAGPNLTFKALSCGATAPSSTATTSTAKIPCSVFKTISAMPGGASINNIFVLANRVLSGQVTCITASDMNAAVDAINTGFDRGKILISATGSSTCTGSVCSSGITAITSTNVASPVSEEASTLAVSTYPNPYSGSVRFMVANPKAGQGSLEVFNLLGQKVSTVYRGFIPAGTQSYNLNLSPLQRTNLIYRLSVGDKQVSGKLLHAKE